jgi:hypothetical protein
MNLTRAIPQGFSSTPAILETYQSYCWFLDIPVFDDGCNSILHNDS